MKFDTYGKFLEHCEAIPGQYKLADDSAPDDWAGGTYDEAMALARYGWPKGTIIATKKATQIVSRLIEHTATGLFEEVGYDVIGAAYDAGAYAQGQPEAWGTLQPQSSKRAVRLVVNISVSAGVPNSAIEARGTTVGALVLALQARGYPVTVDMFWHSITQRGTGKPISLLVRILSAEGSPLDVDRLIYALGHPTMVRRLVRSTLDAESQHRRTWGPSKPDSNKRPEDDGTNIDLFIGGAFLTEVQRWQDGGEAWVLQEYLRQTGA